MRTRKEWRSAWGLVALHTLARVLYALTATMDTTPMHVRHTAITARIGSLGEFSSALARGFTASMDTEGSVLIAQDSAAAVSDSTVAEAGLLDPAGVASLLRAA